MVDFSFIYDWFLGLDPDERVPGHSTISQNWRRRFDGANRFWRLFAHILWQCIEKGLVDGKIILTDSIHVKTNASFKPNVQVMVEREETDYMGRLDRYEATERRLLEESGAIFGHSEQGPSGKSLQGWRRPSAPPTPMPECCGGRASRRGCTT